MSVQFADPAAVMRRACELAARGLGAVEPNPVVGAVIVDDQLRLLGEGYHQKFGGPHAEINALREAGERAGEATLYVTLEPCCHTGKTPPCTEAVIAAGISKVVVGMQDPAPHVAGQGIAQLKAAGIEVEVGLLAEETARLAAPFVKRVTTGLPYVHAKWAMTLDGRIATRTGDSQWISNELSRERVHSLRGRMDAIVIGHGTATADDPLLTARPPGLRTAVRIVFDSRAELPMSSQLVQTARDVPLLIVAHEDAAAENVGKLTEVGADVLTFPTAKDDSSIEARPDPQLLLQELVRRDMTNILVEGGGNLLGTFFDRGLIDEGHVFIAPKIIGGADATAPIGGCGVDLMGAAAKLENPQIELLDGDVYVHGSVSQP